MGNGIIGSLTTLETSKKFPNKKIIFFSPDIEGGASRASGAMLNSIGEIDYGYQFDDYQKIKILLGEQAQKKWDILLKKYSCFAKVKTAKNTVVFCKKNSTKLENDCFREIKKYNRLLKREIKDDATIRKLKENISAKSNFTIIKNEGAIDTKYFFKKCYEILKKRKNVTIVNCQADKIVLKNNFAQVSAKKKSFKSKKIVIACGAYSKDIIKKYAKNIQKNYFGIGTGIIIKSGKLSNLIGKNNVLRTPNRGSTCGIHLVPRNDNEFYLGAGSNISVKPDYQPRIGTLEYLLKSLKYEISDEFDKSNIDITLGYRPMSFDGRPLIGTLNDNKNIFFVGGLKRDGLTLGPVIIEQIINWLKNTSDSNKNYFKMWHPERKPISYGTKEFAIEAYVQNKIGGLIEHKLIKKSFSRVKKELEDEASKFHKEKIKLFNLDSKFGIHPEILNVK